MLSRNSARRTRPRFEIKLEIHVSLGKISPKRLLNCARKIGKAVKWKGRLNILLTGNREIQRINKKYLNHDRPTDVISFGYAEISRRKGTVPRGTGLLKPLKACPPGDCPLAGEIVICLPVTAKQAKIYGNTFFYELCFYICHGMLHIQGWDDKTATLRNRMLKKQADILKKIGIFNQA